jgi:uncharacterized membrane protein YkoI
VEFHRDRWEWDYEISATTGRVLDAEKDWDDDDHHDHWDD